MQEFYNFVEYFFFCYGMEIIGMILVAIFGMLGYAAKKIYEEHINDDTKRAIAKAVVQFVEQAWVGLHGPEKLQKALETASVLLKKKGIRFDAEEMEVLIEACLAEFNEVFKKPLLDEATAAATYRPYEGPQQADSVGE